MGIYIKGMEMPENCNECRFAVDGWCYANPKQANGESLNRHERANFCPLVEVPAHGRPALRGEWAGDYDGYADGAPVYDMWSCSCCGKQFDEWDERPTWKFCPECGADMRDSAAPRNDKEKTEGEREIEMNDWINCKKDKPFAEYGESKSVLTVDSMGEMRVLYFDGGNWCWPTGEVLGTAKIFRITHWMSLPDPPKEG